MNDRQDGSILPDEGKSSAIRGMAIFHSLRWIECLGRFWMK
jgi:hypothetical protein